MSSQPFFRTVERQRALLEEIKSWEGTRFWRGAGGRAKKGVGADCVSFVEKVMVNLGAIQPIVWPKYVTHGAGKEMLAVILDAMDNVPEFQSVPMGVLKDVLRPGDIVVRSVDVEDGERDHHHVAIFTGDNTLYHMRKRGLSRANAEDTYAVRTVQAIYRVYEPAAKSTDERRGANRGAAAAPVGPQVPD